MTKALWTVAWERRILRRAALVHAVTPAETHRIRALAPGAEVRVLPNGVPSVAVKPVPYNANGPWTRLTTTRSGRNVSTVVTGFSWFALGKSNVLPLGLSEFSLD